MICDTFVSCKEVKLGLDSVILFIQEFYLVLKLRDRLFVGFLLVLHVDFFYVLSTTVKTAQSNDLVISCFNGCIQFLDFVFNSKMILY